MNEDAATVGAAGQNTISEDRRQRALYAALDFHRSAPAGSATDLIDSAKAIERYLKGNEDRQEQPAAASNASNIDAVTMHPDGQILVRIDDRWFLVGLLVLK